MAVALELLVFKVQRLVAHRRSLPHISGLLPAAAGVHRAVIDRTLEREVFPFGARIAIFSFTLSTVYARKFSKLFSHDSLAFMLSTFSVGIVAAPLAAIDPARARPAISAETARG